MSAETIPDAIRDTAKAISEQAWMTRHERDLMFNAIAKAIHDAVMAERELNGELTRRVFTWLLGRDTGSSSKAILAQMVCGVSHGEYPYDPADLGRCLRMLELFPEWKARIAEMAGYGKVWAVFIDHWDELSSMMADEVGIDWSKGREAHRTYEFMCDLRKQAGER